MSILIPGIPMPDPDKFFQWDEKTQQFKYAGIRNAILPASIYFYPTVNANPFVLTGVNTPPATFKVPYFGAEGLDEGWGNPVKITQLVFADSTAGAAAAQFLVELQETNTGRVFQNRPVHIRTIAGVAGTPGILREPFMFPSNLTLSCKMQMITGGPDSIRMYMQGEQYFPWTTQIQAKPEDRKALVEYLSAWMKRRESVMPFFLTPDTDISLGDSASGTYYANVGNHAFEAFAICAISTGAFSLQIQEVKTKQTLMNGVVTKDNAMGDANYPSIFPITYLCPAGYNLQFKVTNLTGSTNNIYITLQGRRIFAPMGVIGKQPKFNTSMGPQRAPVSAQPSMGVN